MANEAPDWVVGKRTHVNDFIRAKITGPAAADKSNIALRTQARSSLALKVGDNSDEAQSLARLGQVKLYN